MNRYKKVSLSLIVLLILAACMFFFPYRPVIAFSFENTNKLLAYVPVQTSKTFRIQYTHSIHLTDVVETYRMKEGEIVQVSLQYENFAIGMPSNAEGKEKFVKKNGKYYITNMHRVFPFIDLRIGQVRANHKIIYEGNVFKLSDYMPAGAWVRIDCRKINLWQQLKGVTIHE